MHSDAARWSDRRSEFGHPYRVNWQRRTNSGLLATLPASNFGPFLGHLSSRDEEHYLKRVEVLYQPYYAYEEVLAISGISKVRQIRCSPRMEVLTSYVTDERVVHAAQPEAREEIVRLYAEEIAAIFFCPEFHVVSYPGVHTVGQSCK